jgi:hypothetical protein
MSEKKVQTETLRYDFNTVINTQVQLQNEKWYIGIINNIVYIFITLIVIIILIIYKEGRIFQKEVKEDKIKIDIPTKPTLPKIPPLKFP